MTAVALWVGVGATGGVGALLRWIVDLRVLAAVQARGFPAGTLTVNLTGAVALGVIAGLSLEGDRLLLCGTALVGSYTTFSTWMFETERLVEERRDVPAAINVLISLSAGLGCIALGRLIGDQL